MHTEATAPAGDEYLLTTLVTPRNWLPGALATCLITLGAHILIRVPSRPYM